MNFKPNVMEALEKFEPFQMNESYESWLESFFGNL
jgi:hypothetical protein